MSNRKPAVPVFMIYQLERGETGTLHIQGYVYFPTPRTGRCVQKLLGGKGHLEPRRGFHSEAQAYCSKEDTRVEGPWVFGDTTLVPECQGARTDMSRLLSRSLEIPEAELFEEFPGQMIRYHKGVEHYRQLKRPKRHHQMQNIVVYGESGVGKSYFSMSYPDVYVVPEPKGSGLYWDGYAGQETVVLDDMTGRFMKYRTLLRLLDRHPFQVPYHGGQMEFSSKTIVMTSNTHPSEWYSCDDDWLDSPLRRRLTEGDSCILKLTLEKNPELDDDAPKERIFRFPKPCDCFWKRKCDEPEAIAKKNKKRKR